MINFPINYVRAARYMGEKEITKKTHQLLLNITPLLLNEIQPSFIYKEFNKPVNGLFSGEDIELHLKNSTSFILTASTLGFNVDRFIRKLGFENVLKQIAVDALSSVIVEQFFEDEQKKLADIYKQKNLFLSSSFAPGYGDYSLNCQSVLLNLLDADKRIGLSLTDNNLLIPRKSITGVIGVSNTPISGHLATCGHCKIKDNCSFIKDGKHCYD